MLDAPHDGLDIAGELVPVIADYHHAEDRIELRFQGDGDPTVTLDRDVEGSTLIRMDGLAVGRLLNADGLRVGDIVLTRLP